jgi:hypothetical protein
VSYEHNIPVPFGRSSPILQRPYGWGVELRAFADKLTPMEGACTHLIWELKTAGGKDLKRVVREGDYRHHYPDDYEVADALERAERRLREHERR